MEVHHASVTKNGETTVLLDEKLTLSANSTQGDKTSAAAASISIPSDGLAPGAIRTIGNASVTNSTAPTKIALIGGVKKLKEVSESGMFVVARLGQQRDTQIEYFDFLFGVRGQREDIDALGQKQRPHIAFYPSGNGKFIRLSGYNCELSGDLQYDSDTRQVRPRYLRIKCADLGETIEVSFSVEDPGQVVLSAIRFVANVA